MDQPVPPRSRFLPPLTRTVRTLAFCLMAALLAGSVFPSRAAAEEPSFDPRPLGLMTAARSQEPWGTCWDFAGIAALESSLVAHGIAPNSLDLSEEAVFWSIMANCAKADGSYPTYGWSNARRDTSGFNDMMTGYLATWQGPKLEQDVPYYQGSGDDPLGAFYLEKRPAGLDNAPIPYQVTDIAYLDGASADELKAAVRAYGAVVSGCSLSLEGYRADAATGDGTLWYRSSGGGSFSNHAVAVVGWDDTFDRAKFAPAEDGSLPAEDGAWLVKNSELSEGLAPYIWISYDDDALFAISDHNPAYAIAGVRAAQNRVVHGADENGAVALHTARDHLTCANVFEFAGNEHVRELMFMSLSAGGRYRLLLMPVDDDGAPLPHDPAAVALASGTIPRAGYTTVELAEPYAPPAGKAALVLEVTDTPVASVGLDANTLATGGQPLYTANREAADGSFFIEDGAAIPARDAWGDPVNFSIRAFSTIEPPDPEPTPVPKPEPSPVPPDAIPGPASTSSNVPANVKPPARALAPTSDPHAALARALAATCLMAGALAVGASALRKGRPRS